MQRKVHNLLTNMQKGIRVNAIMVVVNMDIVEQLAIDRAKALFGADYANVQPHSGSQANAGWFIWHY